MLEKIGEVVGWVIGTTFMTLSGVALIALIAGGTFAGFAILVTGFKFLMSALAL
ncbi:hypothetical protein [Fructobacillus ficulneus]|uniref:Uncharacterized protein n=1 Tax=Fructobacillus ficulneus TaxID=157463 RepID=A0A0K8MH03_9LACO|nr:hypothetical protein [Fructobacillus ficulneus]GAO99846.1 hypothetical protein FFIC_241210 [Fructobacillus ficulneus]